MRKKLKKLSTFVILHHNRAKVIIQERNNGSYELSMFNVIRSNHHGSKLTKKFLRHHHHLHHL
ncbi:hypothetical protein BLA29_014688 [Euroglyphus maynei]|uniref:Uncharacterized protein n=1 Tax=Euroglyphus maynei TaxID=6958 RepID=A0A1Y3B0I1_EURMA|nr:hypothetical protein BLA29_014688 [Euroglyphus maynei]